VKKKLINYTPEFRDMNIRDIIREEVEGVIAEGDDSAVAAGLETIVTSAPGVIPELEEFVESNLMAFLEKSLQGAAPLSEAEEDLSDKVAAPIRGAIKGAGEIAKGVAKGTAPVTVPALKLAGHVGSYLPFGKKAGVLIAAALDKTTAAPVRNAILFALGNLMAGSLGLDLPDLGNLLQQIPEIAWEKLPFTDDDQNWDWGVFNAVDDAALGIWAYKKMVAAGIDPQEQLQRFGDFIGRNDLVPQPEGASDEPPGFARDDMSLDAKASRARSMQKKSRKFRGVKEMKINTSELYKIIQEELEVVLTNEEAEEVFDLDMSALLDEMMSEAESDAGSEFLKSKGHDPETAAPFKGTKTKRGAAKHQRRKEKPVGKEIEDLNEEDDWIQDADLKKGRCTPMGTPECPEGSPQYNLAKRFKSGDIHKANLKKGKNPHGPG
jgi:hypothetical protein